MEDLDIEVVPVLHRGRFSSLAELDGRVQAAHEEPSCIGGEKEGVVIRTEQGFTAGEFARRVCKSVRRGHVRTDEHWTRNWRPCWLTG